MSHKKTYYQTLEDKEERAIFWSVVLLFLAFIVWQFIVIGREVGVFNATPLSPKFFVAAWEALVLVWKFRIGPIFIFFNILLIGFFVFALTQYWPIAPRVKFWQTQVPATTRKIKFKKDPAIAAHWGGIVARVKVGTQDAMRYAILEADSLVDHFLKKAGFEGEYMADRLMQIVPERVPSLERAWKAHKLRNELAHTPGMTVTVDETKEALTAFRDFLVELGAM